MSRNLGAFFFVITSSANSGSGSVWWWAPWQKGTWLCSVHTTKRAELVQTLPVKIWLENVKGAVSSHRFYAMSFHLSFCSWDKRIKLFDSITCSVLLQTAAVPKTGLLWVWKVRPLKRCLLRIQFHVSFFYCWCNVNNLKSWGSASPCFKQSSSLSLAQLRSTTSESKMGNGEKTRMIKGRDKHESFKSALLSEK